MIEPWVLAVLKPGSSSLPPVARILFSSKPEWEDKIRQGFKGARHAIQFGHFDTERLAEYEILAALTIPDLLFLADHQALLTQNRLPIPSRDCIQLCDDKIKLNQRLSANGFSALIPATGLRTAPCILKKRTDEWGQNSHMLLNAEDVAAYASKLSDPEYFTQEIISGDCEFTTHIFMRKGQIVHALGVKHVFDSPYPIKGRDTALYTRICRTRFLEEFREVLNHIGFEGLCCINFKLKNGRPMILEINPRFGGSLSPYFSMFVEPILKPQPSASIRTSAQAS